MKPLSVDGEHVSVVRLGAVAAAMLASLALAAAFLVAAPKANAAENSGIFIKDCTINVPDADKFDFYVDGEPISPGQYPVSDYVGSEFTSVDVETDEVNGPDVIEPCDEAAGDPKADATPSAVTIDACTVTVPAVQGIIYKQDKGQDPVLDPGNYQAKHFFPSTSFTATLNGEVVGGPWAIEVPDTCVDDAADPKPADPKSQEKPAPVAAPAAGL